MSRTVAHDLEHCARNVISACLWSVDVLRLHRRQLIRENSVLTQLCLFTLRLLTCFGLYLHANVRRLEHHTVFQC